MPKVKHLGRENVESTIQDNLIPNSPSFLSINSDAFLLYFNVSSSVKMAPVLPLLLVYKHLAPALKTSIVRDFGESFRLLLI